MSFTSSLGKGISMKNFALIILFISSFSLSAVEPQYEILHIKDNVYRFSAGPYHSAYMVSDAGVFVTDPINPEAAEWLKSELKKRYDIPIRYMAYSHNHIDHTAGGEVFAEEGVTVIAHELAARDLQMTKAPTALPDLTFTDTMTINLGNSQVELRYYGSNNGRGNVSMRFMPANVLFVVDWIVVGRMPYKNLPGYDIQGMILSTRAVLDEPPFDHFIGGHAEMGTRTDVENYLAYIEALYAAVRDGMLAGKKLETLQKEISLPAFSNLRMYEEWLPLNIEGVYRTFIDASYFNFRQDITTEF